MEQEIQAETLKQITVTNRLLALLCKITLEAHQNEIEDREWHELENKIKQLKREI